MKVNNLILIATCFIVFQNCTSKSKQIVSSSGKYEFTLNGIVNNGDGLVMELYYPESIDDRLTSTIENGKFTFKDSADRIRVANFGIQGSRIINSVIVEPGIITQKFDIQGQGPHYKFSIPEIIEGSNNKLFYNFVIDIKKASKEGNWVYRDSIKMDSLRRLVFPDSRKRIYNVFDKYYDEIPAELKLILINSITDRLTRRGVFDKNYLAKTDKSKIKDYFSQIDTSLSKIKEYKIAKTNISLIDDLGAEIKFHDYSLENVHGNVNNLSEVIKENKFTILDFWWSDCVPCRKFNQEMNSDYDKLREYGVELVSINIDRSKAKWKAASTYDKVTWKNFYAGKATDIEARYKITSFPTYLVFNNKRELIDVNLKDKRSIFRWIENNGLE